MDVFTRSAVIAGNGDDGDLPSLVDGSVPGDPPPSSGSPRACVARATRGPRGSPTTTTRRTTSTQDVLIGLERRVRRFDGKSRFSTWLFAVTRNVALSHRGATSGAPSSSTRHGELADGSRSSRPTEPIPTPRASPRSCSSISTRCRDGNARSSSSPTCAAGRRPRSRTSSGCSRSRCARTCSGHARRFASECSSITNDC